MTQLQVGVYLTSTSRPLGFALLMFTVHCLLLHLLSPDDESESESNSPFSMGPMLEDSVVVLDSRADSLQI